MEDTIGMLEQKIHGDINQFKLGMQAKMMDDLNSMQE